MNPASVSIPAAPPRAVNDLAGPVPQPQPQAASPPAATTIVANIPVHNQVAPAAPANEDDELDKIMHDVGQELKKEDKKPHKHGLLDFLHKPKPIIPGPIKPTHIARPAARTFNQQQPAPLPATPVAVASATQPQAAQPAAKAAKPKRQSHIPVFVIFVAFVVTGFLAVAAFVAFRQN